MKHTTVENVVRWVLAALMLLATSVTSSTFVHEHTSGNLAHGHGAADCTLTQTSSPTAFHDNHDARVGLSTADVHRHGYFILLGAVDYVPMSGDTSGPHEKSSGGLETLVGVSTANVRSLSKTQAADHVGMISIASTSIDGACASKQPESFYADLAPASPLCDRARHERSGVQLA